MDSIISLFKNDNLKKNGKTRNQSKIEGFLEKKQALNKNRDFQNKELYTFYFINLSFSLYLKQKFKLKMTEDKLLELIYSTLEKDANSSHFDNLKSCIHKTVQKEKISLIPFDVYECKIKERCMPQLQDVEKRLYLPLLLPKNKKV